MLTLCKQHRIFCMSELIQIVDSLENRISKLLHKLEVLRRLNEELENELVSIKSVQQKADKSVSDWEEKYNSLKLANSMLGMNTNKTEAKLKINTLIRELDYCVTQLAE
jgi:chromosome segregation ATPase